MFISGGSTAVAAEPLTLQPRPDYSRLFDAANAADTVAGEGLALSATQTPQPGKFSGELRKEETQLTELRQKIAVSSENVRAAVNRFNTHSAAVPHILAGVNGALEFYPKIETDFPSSGVLSARGRRALEWLRNEKASPNPAASKDYLAALQAILERDLARLEATPAKEDTLRKFRELQKWLGGFGDTVSQVRALAGSASAALGQAEQQWKATSERLQATRSLNQSFAANLQARQNRWREAYAQTQALQVALIHLRLKFPEVRDERTGGITEPEGRLIAPVLVEPHPYDPDPRRWDRPPAQPVPAQPAYVSLAQVEELCRIVPLAAEMARRCADHLAAVDPDDIQHAVSDIRSELGFAESGANFLRERIAERAAKLEGIANAIAAADKESTKLHEVAARLVAANQHFRQELAGVGAR